MNIVFMGTPEFAVASLDILLQNNYKIVGVVTSPDKPAGRGQLMQQSAIKKYALAHHLNLLQPANLKDEGFIKQLKDLHADLQIVVAFRMLPEVVWNMPLHGTYNLHASLLPKYRGAAPINWAVMNGDKETGVTTFKLRHEIDTGNILFQSTQVITETTTAGELHDQLMQKGADLILQTVKTIERSVLTQSKLVFITQNEAVVSHAPKLNKELCRIKWSNDAVSIYNLIRGLSPFPTAYTLLNTGDAELSIKVFKSKYEKLDHTFTNGTLITDNKTFLKVFCKDGLIELMEIQLQGKKRMSIADFLKGFKLKDGAKFI